MDGSSLCALGSADTDAGLDWPTALRSASYHSQCSSVPTINDTDNSLIERRTPVLNIVVPLHLGLLEPLIRKCLELLQQLLLPRAQQLVVLRIHKPLDEFLPRPT